MWNRAEFNRHTRNRVKNFCALCFNNLSMTGNAAADGSHWNVRLRHDNAYSMRTWWYCFRYVVLSPPDALRITMVLSRIKSTSDNNSSSSSIKALGWKMTSLWEDAIDMTNLQRVHRDDCSQSRLHTTDSHITGPGMEYSSQTHSSTNSLLYKLFFCGVRTPEELPRERKSAVWHRRYRQ